MVLTFEFAELFILRQDSRKADGEGDKGNEYVMCISAKLKLFT